MKDKLDTKGYIVERDYDGDSDNYERWLVKKPNGETIRSGIYTYALKDFLKSLPDLTKKKVEKKMVEKKSKPSKKVLKVTFEYSEGNDTKSVKVTYDEDYTPEEYETLLTYVIDSILPTSFASVEEKRLGDAWDDYKFARERGRV